LPLGSREDVLSHLGRLASALPWEKVRDTVWRIPPEGSLEVASLGAMPITSLHLALRFGPGWSKASDAQVKTLLGRMFKELHWQAFAVSDNSSQVDLRTLEPWS
jgi:hypothetical protein